MKLHIVIVEPDETRARLVIDSLQPLGHKVTVIAEAAGRRGGSAISHLTSF